MLEQRSLFCATAANSARIGLAVACDCGYQQICWTWAGTDDTGCSFPHSMTLWTTLPVPRDRSCRTESMTPGADTESSPLCAQRAAALSHTRPTPPRLRSIDDSKAREASSEGDRDDPAGTSLDHRRDNQ